MLCTIFRSHLWIQTEVTVRKRSIRVKIVDFSARVTLKFEEWHRKTIEHLFYIMIEFWGATTKGKLISLMKTQRRILFVINFVSISTESVPLFIVVKILSAINTFRLRQNGRHFVDDILKCIFLNENGWIPLKISLKLFLRFELTIFQRWFRLWLSAVLATSHYLNQWWLVYCCGV